MLCDFYTFKQWLADQYAAGTPVIIVYVLKTETTETSKEIKLANNALARAMARLKAAGMQK